MIMVVPARIGAVLTLVAGFGAAASGDPLQDGADAFSKNRYVVAMRVLAPLADAGDPAAGCMVKVMLDRSEGRVAYDADGMASTCLDAAVGKAAAELELAGDYRTGLIVEKDWAKAAQLYRHAADQGTAVAQKVLGDLYAEGIGVERDLAAACTWWGRAAMQGGSSEAQRDFGGCYLTGTGVARSETQALAWWLIAKDHETADKDGLPAWMFQSEAEADRLSAALLKRLPADQVAEARAFARAWRPVPE